MWALWKTKPVSVWIGERERVFRLLEQVCLSIYLKVFVCVKSARYCVCVRIEKDGGSVHVCPTVGPDWAIFESSWLQIFWTKVAHIFGNFLGYFKRHYFVRKNSCGYFLPLFGTFGPLFNSNIWSHCVWGRERESVFEREREVESCPMWIILWEGRNNNI